MGFGFGYSERDDRGMTGRANYKRVFPNGQAAHVWAQQTQEEGRTSNGNLYWTSMQTIYSYRDSWPLARFTDIQDDTGKTLVLVNDEKVSVTTSGHLSDVYNALRGLPVRLVSCDRDQLACYSHSPESAKVGIVNDAIQALLDAARAHANARSIKHWEAEGYSYHATTGESSLRTALTWEQRRDSRMSSLEKMATGIQDLADLLGVDMSSDVGLKSFDVPVLQAAICGEFNRYYDTALVAKREKTRLARVKHQLLDRVKSSYDSLRSDTSSPRYKSRMAQAVKDLWSIGTDEQKASAMAYLSGSSALLEQQAMHKLLHPDADAIVYRNRHGHDRQDRLTPDEWMNGKPGTLDYSSATLVRRKGDSLETSRHAEAPFKHAVAIFAKAQACRHTGTSWHRNGETMTAGHFQLDAIDTDGNISIGCHRIAFTEMQRLAVREVPAMVKPMYQLPACI